MTGIGKHHDFARHGGHGVLYLGKHQAGGFNLLHIGFGRQKIERAGIVVDAVACHEEHGHIARGGVGAQPFQPFDDVYARGLPVGEHLGHHLFVKPPFLKLHGAGEVAGIFGGKLQFQVRVGILAYPDGQQVEGGFEQVGLGGPFPFQAYRGGFAPAVRVLGHHAEGGIVLRNGEGDLVGVAGGLKAPLTLHGAAVHEGFHVADGFAVGRGGRVLQGDGGGANLLAVCRCDDAYHGWQALPEGGLCHHAVGGGIGQADGLLLVVGHEDVLDDVGAEKPVAELGGREEIGFVVGAVVQMPPDEVFGTRGTVVVA